MGTPKLPLLQLRRGNGELKELTVGPCAAWTLVAVVITVALTVLLLAGVLTREDVGPLLRFVLNVLPSGRN